MYLTVLGGLYWKSPRLPELLSYAGIHINTLTEEHRSESKQVHFPCIHFGLSVV